MPETAAGFHSCALFSPIKLPKYTHVLSLTDENSFDLDSIGSTSPAYLAEKIYTSFKKYKSLQLQNADV